MAEHVLMIEDDAALSAMVSEYLGSFGLQVTTRTTAASGLKLLQQGGVDVLILDIMLPDLGGERRTRVHPGPVILPELSP